jgi:heme/copper-type cytochrome/quinol oxidase subunit 1
MTSRAAEWARRNFLIVDIIGVTLATSIIVDLAWLNLPALESVSLARRDSLYSIGIGAGVSLLGFVIVAITILTALPPTPAVTSAKSSPFFWQVNETFVIAISFLAVLSAALVVSEVIDTGPSIPLALFAVLMWLTLASTVAVGRSIQLLGGVARLVTPRPK